MSDTAAVLRPTPYRLAPARDDRPRDEMLGGGLSLLLHLLALAVLLAVLPYKKFSDPAPSPAIAMVFEGGAKSPAQSVPDSQRSAPSTTPDQATRQPQPQPGGNPGNTSPAANQPPSPLAPEATPSAPLDAVPEASVPQAPQGEAILPLPRPTETHRTTELRPQAHPAHAAPRAAATRSAASALSSSLSAPMNFSFSGSPPPPASQGRLSRGINLAMAPTDQNRNIMTRYAEARHELGEDWWSEFSQFVEDHKYYPMSAAQKGEDGQVVLRLTIARDGTVLAVHTELSSGAPLLDAAWISEFRGNKVPPFPPGTAQDQVTFSASMTYILEHM